MVGVVNGHVDVEPMNIANCSRRSSSMFNSEGGRISYIVLQKLFFFYLRTGICQYFSPTTRLPSHKDTGIGCNSQSKPRREACGGEASQQSAKKGTGYTNFSDTDRADISRYAAEYWNATAQHYYCYYTHACKKLSLLPLFSQQIFPTKEVDKHDDKMIVTFYLPL